MLLTDKGKLLPIFFCHIVEVVIANNATKEAKTPIVGRLVPISKPKTNAAPKKPSSYSNPLFERNILHLKIYLLKH